MKLTNASIENLACPIGKAEAIYFCDQTPGFALRIRASGVRRWIVQYETHGRTKRITIGPPDLFTAEQARRVAREQLAKARLGHDPAAEKAAERVAAKLTLGSIVDQYLADRKGKLRPNSMAALQRYLLRWWKPLHGMPLHKITRRDIAAHLIGQPVAAARARSRLMELYSWAMQRGLVEANPVIGTPIPDEHVRPRERVLSGEELAAIWRACRDDLYGKIVRLLIYRDVAVRKSAPCNGGSWIRKRGLGLFRPSAARMAAPTLCLCRKRLGRLLPASRHGMVGIIYLADDQALGLGQLTRRFSISVRELRRGCCTIFAAALRPA